MITMRGKEQNKSSEFFCPKEFGSAVAEYSVKGNRLIKVSIKRICVSVVADYGGLCFRIFPF